MVNVIRAREAKMIKCKSWREHWNIWVYPHTLQWRKFRLWELKLTSQRWYIADVWLICNQNGYNPVADLPTLSQPSSPEQGVGSSWLEFEISLALGFATWVWSWAPVTDPVLWKNITWALIQNYRHQVSWEGNSLRQVWGSWRAQRCINFLLKAGLLSGILLSFCPWNALHPWDLRGGLGNGIGCCLFF